MAQKWINIRVQVDAETDLQFADWSENEGRSKRRHVSILLRKLARLRKSRPQELERLGLIEPLAALA